MNSRKLAFSALALLALVLIADAASTYRGTISSTGRSDSHSCLVSDGSGTYVTRWFTRPVGCCVCTSDVDDYCYGCSSSLDCSPTDRTRTTCSGTTGLAVGIIIAIIVIPIAIAIIVTIIIICCCCCAAAAAAGGSSGHTVSGSTAIVTQSAPAQPVYVEETTYAQPTYVQTNSTVEMQAVPNQYGQPVYVQQQQGAPGYY